MRIVFGPNILISALVFPGNRASAAIKRIIDGDDVLVLSGALMDDILSVLASKFDRDKEVLSRTAVFLADLGAIVKPAKRIKLLADEPDNRVLECAVAGHADRIVTGDKKMLQVKEYAGIRIISLKEYLEC